MDNMTWTCLRLQFPTLARLLPNHAHVIGVALRVIGYTLMWYCFSIGITFYNKWLFMVKRRPTCSTTPTPRRPTTLFTRCSDPPPPPPP